MEEKFSPKKTSFFNFFKLFQKKKKFDPEKVKKRASKVAHNRPRPFYFTVQPRPRPTAQNWFFILWNLGKRHLFSYLCVKLFIPESQNNKHLLKQWIHFSVFTLAFYQRYFLSFFILLKTENLKIWFIIDTSFCPISYNLEYFPKS